MDIEQLKEKLGGKQSGEWWRADFCPICNKPNNCFAINTRTGVYKCHVTDKTGHINQLEGFENLNIYDFKNKKIEKEVKNFNDVFPLHNHLKKEWEQYLNGRGLTVKSWDVVARQDRKGRMAIPLTDGTKIVGIKYRQLDKKPSSELGSSTNYLINHQNATNYDKYLYIFEGEIDLMSALECDYSNSTSLPFGVHNLKFIETQKDYLKRFKGVVLAFDNDKAGVEGIEKAKAKLTGFKLYTLNYGNYKDLNEILEREGSEKVKQVLENIQLLETNDEQVFFKKKADAINHFIKQVIPNHINDFVSIWGTDRYWTGKYWASVSDKFLSAFIDKHFIWDFVLLEKDYKELKFQIDKEIKMLDEVKPKHKLVFTFENGTLKFNDGLLEFEKGSFNKEDYCLYKFECEYIYPDNPIGILGHNSLFKKWIDTKIEDEKERNSLKMAITNLFLPYFMTEIFTFIKGNQESGKSSFVDSITNAVNKESISALPFDNEDKFSKGALYNSIINITAETSEKIIDANKFKSLITRDTDLYRQAYSSTTVTARPLAKHLNIGNNLPNVMIKDGVERRLFLVTLNDERVEYDGDFKADMITDKMGVVEIIVQGLFLMDSMGLLKNPELFNKALREGCNALLKQEITMLTNPDADEFGSLLSFGIEKQLKRNEFFIIVRGVDIEDPSLSIKEKAEIKKDRKVFTDRLDRFIQSTGHKIRTVKTNQNVNCRNKEIIKYYQSKKCDYYYYGLGI